MAVTAVLHPDLQRIPVGTTCKAYKRSNFAGTWNRTGAPEGSQDASATVAADGSVTFTGLTAETEYVLYALVSSAHVYIGFSTKTENVGGTSYSGAQDFTSATVTLANGTVTAAMTAADVATQAELDQEVTDRATAIGLVIAKSLVDAKGDLLVGTANDTVGRLAVGTNDYVLVADSTQTSGLKWSAMARSSYQSGLWYASRGSTNTGTTVLNEVRYTKFRAERKFTVADMAIELITPGAAGSVVRLGIYTDANDGPDSKVVEAPGIIDTTAAAAVRQQSAGAGGATMATVLEPGVYWLATASQGATCQLKCINGNPQDPEGDTLANVMANTNVGRLQTGVSGALPATATPSATSQAFCPKVAVKAA